MLEKTDPDLVTTLNRIELTALILFSAVMFFLLAQVFKFSEKQQTVSFEQAITPTSEVSPQQSAENSVLNTPALSETLNETLGEEIPAVKGENEITQAVAESSVEIPDAVLPTQALDQSEVQKVAVYNLCDSIDKKLGSVTLEECLTSDLLHSGSLSTQQKPLVYRDFLIGSPDNKTRIMLIGGIHGDEFSGVSISFKWLHSLVKAYADQTGKEVDDLHWRVIPILNPDGLLRPDGESHRMNSNDVDLNRNFPTPDWDELAIKFWKEKRYSDKRRYPGPASGSEIETQWIVSQMDEFEPHAVISVHAPYGIVDADGPTDPPPNLGPLQLKILGTYPGSMGRYIGVHKNLAMLTVELKHAGIMPSEKDTAHIWTDILNWIDDKVVSRRLANNEDSALQSMRHEINGTTKEIVIDKKAGD